jgi:drug/metabolite transporter (DMT)-like permease
VPYLLALTSAALYGAADFIGGFTSRRADTIAVVLISQFAGLLSLALLLPLMPPVAPTGRDLMWGAAAGLSSSVGVALLYRGLAIGTMAIIAPTTAVCAVIVPVAVSVALGEQLSRVALAGIVLALVAIVLVAQETRRPDASADDERATHASPLRRLPRGLGLAFLSGIAIGGFFLFLARARPEAALWPMLVSRGSSVVLFGIIAMVSGRSLRMPVTAAGMAIGGGIVDMAANTLYLIATWSGSLSVIVTLASLYPASTVMLARVFLRERLNRVQLAGVVCVLVAILTIVAGN